MLGLAFIILGFATNVVGAEHQISHFAIAHPLFEFRIGNLLALGLGQIALEPGDKKHSNNKVPE